MRIFITGIAGFLGSHLAERLLAMNHHVVGCDSLLGGELVNVPPDAEFYQYDCRDFNAMAAEIVALKEAHGASSDENITRLLDAIAYLKNYDPPGYRRISRACGK